MKRFIALLILVLSTILSAQAQNKPEPLTEQEKRQTIDSINQLLTGEYIFPETALKMTDALSANLKKGNYQPITNPVEFAERLTADLISVSNDRHFLVSFDPEWVNENKKRVTKKDSLELINHDISEFKKDNFAFKELKNLNGNIGYLNLIGFCPASYAGATAVAAMDFLYNADAIIIDLRDNGGGSPEMVQLLSSYFLPAEPQLLVEFYTRKGKETQQFYSLPYLSGERMPEKDLYILTSQHTFSAAEDFAYIMKNRKRAVVIGERTGGGAHPVSHLIINDKFSIRIPTTKAMDPITRTDWEGSGITPDFEVPANDALVTAQIKALEKLASVIPDNRVYLWDLDVLKGRQHPTSVPAEILKSYTGKYGHRKIFFEEGSLFFQKDGGEKHRLIPVGRDLFLVDELDYLKIKITVENNQATALTRLFDNGDTSTDKKDQ